MNQASGDFNRYDVLSSVLIRATDAVTVDALVNSINDDRRLNATAQTLQNYMDAQTNSAAPIQYLGVFVSIIMAVGGIGGLQIFHFNGASPITKYTGLLTTSTIDKIYWDNSNHLYAISGSAGKLYVFTITPTSYSQASGSPYSVGTPVGLIVQPPPWY